MKVENVLREGDPIFGRVIIVTGLILGAFAGRPAQASNTNHTSNLSYTIDGIRVTSPAPMNFGHVSARTIRTLSMTHGTDRCLQSGISMNNEGMFLINLTNPLPPPFVASRVTGTMPQGQRSTANFDISCDPSLSAPGTYRAALTVSYTNANSLNPPPCGINPPDHYTHGAFVINATCTIVRETPSPTPQPSPIPTPPFESKTGPNIMIVLDRSSSMNDMANGCSISTDPPIARSGNVAAFISNPCGRSFINPSTCVYDPDLQKIDLVRQALTGNRGLLHLPTTACPAEGCVCKSSGVYMSVDPRATNGFLYQAWKSARWGIVTFGDDSTRRMLGIGATYTQQLNRFFDFDGDSTMDQPSGGTQPYEVFASTSHSTPGLIKYFRTDVGITSDPWNLLFHAPDRANPNSGGCRDNFVILISDGRYNSCHYPLNNNPCNETVDANVNPVLSLYHLGATLAEAGEGNNLDGHVRIYPIAVGADPAGMSLMDGIADCGDDGDCTNYSSFAYSAQNLAELQVSINAIFDLISADSCARVR